MAMRLFQVVGRRQPTEANPAPQIYRMRIFAKTEVVAQSRFWYFMRQMSKMKKATGEILAINEIRERNPRIVKNFGVTLRYNSRSGTHNMYKEYRDQKLTGAIDQMYGELAGRHRVRFGSIQIIDAKPVPAGVRARKAAMVHGEHLDNIVQSERIRQFLNANIKFPLAHRVPRASARKFKTTFKANRPTTFHS